MEFLFRLGFRVEIDIYVTDTLYDITLIYVMLWLILIVSCITCNIVLWTVTLFEYSFWKESLLATGIVVLGEFKNEFSLCLQSLCIEEEILL